MLPEMNSEILITSLSGAFLQAKKIANLVSYVDIFVYILNYKLYAVALIEKRNCFYFSRTDALF